MPKRSKRIVKSNEVLSVDRHEIPYVLSRSSRRRTLAISIDDKGSVSVYSPLRSPDTDIRRFVQDKASWIVKHVLRGRHNALTLEQKRFVDGQDFLFLGKKYTLHVQPADVKRGKINFDGCQWHVSVPDVLAGKAREEQVKKLMIRWYRKEAEEVLGARLFYYGRMLKSEPKKVAIRTHRRIWGNCDYATQTIHLNWQIILAPMDVVDYVIVHELCHLTVPNHSKRFWKKVEKFYPGFKAAQQWLRKNTTDMTLP